VFRRSRNEAQLGSLRWRYENWRRTTALHEVEIRNGGRVGSVSPPTSTQFLTDHTHCVAADTAVPRERPARARERCLELCVLVVASWHSYLQRSRVRSRTPVFSRGCLLPRVGRTDVQWSQIRFSGSDGSSRGWVFPEVVSSLAEACESQQQQLHGDGLQRENCVRAYRHTYIQTLDDAHNSQAQGLNLTRGRSLGGKRTVDIDDEQTDGLLDEI